MERNVANEAADSAARAAGWQARLLLRGARMGSLATASGGQPFVALVTPATAPDLSVLLLLSSLSEHTRQLQAEPRCALLVSGPPEGANPQTAARLTVTGLAEPAPDAALKARWLARHPYAALYADFADFSLWRMRPLAGLLVGGFARATRLRQASLLPNAAAVAAVAAAEEGILAHCNADHADALAAIAGVGGAWRMVACDVDGCDLACGETVRRIDWAGPVADAMGVRAELVRLAGAARAAATEK
ncbi:MAG: pyridoxamine 5'-phosphate oxidase family protein [Rhodospirillales bacterium]|nr:pyridoxamine 5'-phosphate oxidase family protein [Rhodospirillales bacterium]MDE2575301.1 pyridoxamine 5'-phosphate oxidase family protein [Rhodospirillales bacterium]